MARILASLKIFPSDVEVNLDTLRTEIKKALPTYASVYEFEEEPIAFGLVALIAHILLPEDKPGGIDEIEASLQKLKHVGELQTQMVRRV